MGIVNLPQPKSGQCTNIGNMFNAWTGNDTRQYEMVEWGAVVPNFTPDQIPQIQARLSELNGNRQAAIQRLQSEFNDYQQDAQNLPDVGVLGQNLAQMNAQTLKQRLGMGEAPFTVYMVKKDGSIDFQNPLYDLYPKDPSFIDLSRMPELASFAAILGEKDIELLENAFTNDSPFMKTFNLPGTGPFDIDSENCFDSEGAQQRFLTTYGRPTGQPFTGYQNPDVTRSH
ncbi:MAG: hypothetical protein SFZ03_07575 [Candidatus Melainabacteria bacterium]|nr:hypothetical protein [Candidatus Melainabacteria bacterium]